MLIRPYISRLWRGLQGWWHSRWDRPPTPSPLLDHVVIGASHQDRAVDCYHVGSGSHNILFCGGIHGNEVGTVKLMYHWLQWLNEHVASYPNLNYFVIPCLNPDGYAAALKAPGYFSLGRTGRLNGNQVDLNRNFPTPSHTPEANWNHGQEYLDTTRVSAGEYGGSEPEMKALTNFVTQESIEVIFMFHSVGADVMGNGAGISEHLVEIYAQEANFRAMAPDHWHELGQTGCAPEWAAQHGIALVEVEASVRWGSDWSRQKAALVACLKALNVDTPNNLRCA